MVMNQTTLLTPCYSSDSPHIRLLLLTLNVPLNENEKWSPRSADDNRLANERVTKLLLELDAQPKQVLIEAKVLEVTLDDGESYGVD